MRRAAAAAVLFGLVLSLTTGSGVAGAQLREAPTYPWTAGDPTLAPWLIHEGSTTTAYDGQSWPSKNGIATQNGWTFEAWVKIPSDGSAGCVAQGYCALLSFRNLRSVTNKEHFTWWLNTTAATSGTWGMRQSHTADNGYADHNNASAVHGPSMTALKPSWTQYDQWHLVTIVHDPARLVTADSFYIDGVAVAFGQQVDVNSTWWDNPVSQTCMWQIATCQHHSYAPIGVHLADARLTLSPLQPDDIEARREAIMVTGSVSGPGVYADAPPGGFAPRLACGRTLRDMGNGQWFADAEAIVRNPPTDGAVDSAGFWYSSWDPFVDFATGKKVTFPLPAGASTNDSLWVTYVMERTYTVPVGWKTPTPTQGTKAVDVETKGGVVLPGVSWVLRAAAKLTGEALDDDDDWEDDAVDEFVGGGTHTIYVDADEIGDDLPAVPELTTVVRKVKATCTMRVSPVTNHIDPPVIVVNAPVHSDDDTTTIINNPPAPGDKTAEETCGGGAWYNPITWAKSLYCAVRDVVAGIGDLFDWLDLPDGWGFGWVTGLLPEWQTKFPLSVIVEATEAVNLVHDALAASVDDSTTMSASALMLAASEDDLTVSAAVATSGGACGPSIDPDLDQRISLPGTGTTAKLDALRASLPVPKPCPGQSADVQHAADLLGMRRPLRGFLTITLYAAFLVRVVSSFGPKRNGLEPDGIEDVDAWTERWS